MSAGRAKPRKARKAVRQEEIISALRARIVAGELVPGSKIPSRRAFAREFNTSSITLQKALERLIRDGFLCTRGHAGTFVAAQPPHLHAYGVLFHDHFLTRPNDGTFWAQLAYHCLALQQAGDTRLNLYFGITGHTDEPDYQRAEADLAAHRLAGLIYAATFTPLRQTPLAAPSLPRVALFAESVCEVPFINTPLTLFFEKALARLTERGRHRIALIGITAHQVRDVLTPIIERFGAITHRLWQLPAHMHQPCETMESVRIATTLMMGYGDQQPDGVIVFDDILVDYVVAGLLDAGLRIEEDIDVVAHCNYPLARLDQWPIQRLGFSVPDILDTALSLLAKQQQRLTPPERVIATPLFPEELQGAAPERATAALVEAPAGRKEVESGRLQGERVERWSDKHPNPLIPMP